MKTKKSLIFSIAFSLLVCIGPKPSANSASDINEKALIPGGKCVGVTLSTNGVLVTDIFNVSDEKAGHSSPAKEAGLKPGDLIQSFNNVSTPTVVELDDAIRTSDGREAPLKFIRDGKEHQTLITPQLSQMDKSYKIGAWVKDAASGIGTVTYFDPETNKFAALGHGICDSDTGEILNINKGEIFSSSIVTINKGQKGIPGELNGVFEEDSRPLGQITANIASGIFGKSDKTFLDDPNLLPVASKKDVEVGKAQILSNIEGKSVKKFDIEIVRLMSSKLSPQKEMIIKITDPNLLEKTGGIVRGM